jgi:hypothetical protein
MLRRGQSAICQMTNKSCLSHVTHASQPDPRSGQRDERLLAPGPRAAMQAGTSRGGVSASGADGQQVFARHADPELGPEAVVESDEIPPQIGAALSSRLPASAFVGP